MFWFLEGQYGEQEISSRLAIRVCKLVLLILFTLLFWVPWRYGLPRQRRRLPETFFGGSIIGALISGIFTSRTRKIPRSIPAPTRSDFALATAVSFPRARIHKGFSCPQSQLGRSASSTELTANGSSAEVEHESGGQAPIVLRFGAIHGEMGSDPIEPYQPG